MSARGCRGFGTKAPRLVSDEAGVEASGDAGVGGSLDDGAAVGEEGHFVGLEGEAQGEFIGDYGA